MRLSLNKNTLKRQRDRLGTYRRFLPSLDLKRQQLMVAHKAAQRELAELEQQAATHRRSLESLLPMLGSSTIDAGKLAALVRVDQVVLTRQNVVGARLPVIERIELSQSDYSPLSLPFWVDGLIDALERAARLQIQLQVARCRVERLGAAARKITQRVNLFEKVLIPQAESNIKRINVALSDQERSSVVRSKLAKRKRPTH